MVNQDIQNWLKSDQDYNIGVALYNKYGTSETLKRMFSWGKTAYNQAKLIDALEAVQKAGVVIPSGVDPNQNQTEVEKLDQQWKPIYKEASYMHSQLHHVDANQRKEYAFAILNAFDQMDPIWKKKDALLKGEGLPDPEPVAVADELDTPVKMLKKITNLTVQISKHKDNAARAQEVATWRLQRDELKRRLKDG